MGTKSEKFVNERKEYWEKIGTIIKKIRKHGYKSLNMKEFQDFPNLYRKICTDSETAKTLQLSPDTVNYIEDLVSQAHNILHSSPRKTFSQFTRFFLYSFPDSFLKNFIPLTIIFVLFFGGGSLVFTIIYLNPEYAKHIISEYYIEAYKNMYKDEVSRAEKENIEMAGFYIYNNVTIGFGSFVFGVAYGIITLYIIFTNAVTLGAVFGILFSSGYGYNLLNFVIAHSAFELLGICLAAGAGFSLGGSLIFVKEEKRSIIFSRKARELVPIVIVAGIFIFTAAFIEGFISPRSELLINLTIKGIEIFKFEIDKLAYFIIKVSIAVISALIIIFLATRIIILKFSKKIIIKKKKYYRIKSWKN